MANYAKYWQNGRLMAIPSVDVTDIYNKGKSEGIAETEASFAAKHFSAIVTIGADADTSKLSFAPSFDPDIITIQCVDSKAALAGEYVVLSANFFRNGISEGYGYGAMAKTGNTSTRVFSSETSTVTIADDGTITVSNLLFGTSNQYTGVFGAGMRYAVFCEKL